jgi:hypothetical protein
VLFGEAHLSNKRVSTSRMAGDRASLASVLPMSGSWPSHALFMLRIGNMSAAHFHVHRAKRCMWPGNADQGSPRRRRAVRAAAAASMAREGLAAS